MIDGCGTPVSLASVFEGTADIRRASLKASVIDLCDMGTKSYRHRRNCQSLSRKSGGVKDRTPNLSGIVQRSLADLCWAESSLLRQFFDERLAQAGCRSNFPNVPGDFFVERSSFGLNECSGC